MQMQSIMTGCVRSSDEKKWGKLSGERGMMGLEAKRRVVRLGQVARSALASLADLEVGDTAGVESCVTTEGQAGGWFGQGDASGFSVNLPRFVLIATSQAVAWLTHFSFAESSIAARAVPLKAEFPSQNHRNAWLSSKSLIPCIPGTHRAAR
jgi:hypothetical protein